MLNKRQQLLFDDNLHPTASRPTRIALLSLFSQIGFLNQDMKQPRIRPWFLVTVIAIAVFVGWVTWPDESGTNPLELSRGDGKPRFHATSYSKIEFPPGTGLYERIVWTWLDFRRRHSKKNPAAYSFSPRPIQSHSISGMLNQCMEVTGTQYLISVEVLGGTFDFNNTSPLTGSQWVAAIEGALQTNIVDCFDYTKKRRFEDTLLLIRERPDLVKVVPRSKLSEYQNAGLVKKDFR